MINITINSDRLMIASGKDVTADDLVALGKLLGVVKE